MENSVRGSEEIIDETSNEIRIAGKFEAHGKALKRGAVLSPVWQIGVCFVITFVLFGALVPAAMFATLIYGAGICFAGWRRMQRDKKYYSFEPGNPAYDYLSRFGVPEIIAEGIGAEIKEGRVYYRFVSGKGQSAPETFITERWFMHFDKKTVVIPLDEIVCAYIYDRQTGETPDERYEPTRFKPVFLNIVYSDRLVASIRHTAVDYNAALKALDNKLRCKIRYTRELDKLFNEDYGAFVENVKGILSGEAAEG